MASQIRVLVVDDSAFMRKVITELLEAYDDIEVVTQARNGVDALKKLDRYSCDLITLDIEMPKMDGLEFLNKLMDQNPIPVVMLSSVTEEGSKATIKALELGAFDFIPKPSGAISLDIQEVEEDLVRKVRLAAQSSWDYKGIVKKEDNVKRKVVSAPPSVDEKKILLIGASTGGPRALKEIFSRLPGDLNACGLVVQHMPAGFTNSLAKRLNRLSEFKVKEASNGDELVPGQALVAPGDYHMLVKKGKVKLSQEAKQHNVRPAIDKTIETAVKEYGNRIIGVLLTGMGKDGVYGLEMIKESGGQTIAQDKKTSIVYGMPRMAYEAGVVDVVKPLSKIGEEIVKQVNIKN